MPHVHENEKPIMLASSLSAYPALAIEYVSAPIRKEAEKHINNTIRKSLYFCFAVRIIDD
jgi:hypothetical protein